MSDKSDVARYLGTVEKIIRGGDFTELSLRSALEKLLNSALPRHRIVHEPKKRNAGRPDFLIKEAESVVGVVETKDIAQQDLSILIKTEQVQKYLEQFGEIILTNYISFIRVNATGQVMDSCEVATLKKGRLERTPSAEHIISLLQSYVGTGSSEKVESNALAVRLAATARRIKDAVGLELKDSDEAKAVLRDHFASFKSVLMSEMTEDNFADMFAQTVVYGLFAAKCHNPTAPFSRKTAAYDLPNTTPFLKKLFESLAGTDLDVVLTEKLDEVVGVLNTVKFDQLLTEFQSRKTDPVIQFYETFLGEYDSSLKKKRGVYFTPPPVVKFICKAVDSILKSEFRILGGVANAEKIKQQTSEGIVESHRVLFLDPATGTGTFLREIVDMIASRAAQNKSVWKSYVSEHLLPRIFGFEILMAPYAIAHLKLGIQLLEHGYSFKKNERLNIYLTNTLEEVRDVTSSFPFARWLSEEAKAASQVKKKSPVMVVLGNPPYSVSSQNKGEWIENLLEDYKDGLNERKLNLDDDYIKFFRFAQWRIEQTGYGVIAFISNNSFIDGITHRQMRKQLSETFSSIYVLDLHGNSNKKEKCPDGSKDENVFDIKQGVCISFFVRSTTKSKGLAKVYFSELFGLRDSKYETLETSTLDNIDWKELALEEPYYFFSPKDLKTGSEYKAWWSITDVFHLYQNGVTTDRDELFVDFEKSSLDRRMKKFYSDEGMTVEFRDKYNVYTSSSYDILSKRKASSYSAKHLHRFLYRPFDTRWIYYHPEITSRPGWDVGQHLVGDSNEALVTTRQTKDHWRAMITKHLAGHKSVAAYDRNSIFPLYLLDDGGALGRYAGSEKDRRPNLSNRFVRWITYFYKVDWLPSGQGDFKTKIGPEDVFNYIYSVLNSPTYIRNYSEFLKLEFSRIPFVSKISDFAKLAKIGSELRQLHLNGHESVQNLLKGEGDNTVDFVKITVQKGRELVYINETQYFDLGAGTVADTVVGGYQVLHRWLKDREGRTLTFDEIQNYSSIVYVLREERLIGAKIDLALEAAGGLANIGAPATDLTKFNDPEANLPVKKKKSRRSANDV